MNFTEQKNYLVAVFVSLIIHFLLLTICLPGIPAQKKQVLEELHVGLVEISSENKSRRISVELNTPGKWQPQKVAAADTLMKMPKNQSASSENVDLKSAVKPNQPSDDAAILPEKEEVAASDDPAKKPENQSAFSGDIEEITGSENSGTGGPHSFGTGEAMVKIIGSMPTYPPAALKEGKGGKVAVRILVNAGGKLELVIVTKSSGDVRLDYAATSSIERKWKFTPINKGYYIDLTFSFDIHIGASVKFLDSKTRS